MNPTGFEPESREKTNEALDPTSIRSGSGTAEADDKARRIDLLLDVPLDVQVELGRTRMSIQRVLALTNGSVIELDKAAGEPLDILFNGRLVARGEAVIVGERFGVRITDIVSPRERLARMR